MNKAESVYTVHLQEVLVPGEQAVKSVTEQDD